MENPIEVQKQARSFRNVPTRQLATFYYNQLMQFKRLGAHYLGMSNTVEEVRFFGLFAECNDCLSTVL